MEEKLYIDWAGHKWLTRQRWGQVHPNGPYQWYDPSAVQINNDGSLSLYTQKNGKFFPELDTISEVGTGLISSTQPFFYGRYELTCKLPTGKNLWPAFWMWGWNSWPPEIDIFEGYTNKKGCYFSPSIKTPTAIWKVQSNVYYSKDEKEKSIGGKSHYLGFKNPSNRCIEFAMEWLPNKIEIFYDGRMVRRITDSFILNQMNNAEGMNVIISNGVKDSYDVEDCFSDFRIKNFNFESF